jgi:hypothetical protein
MITGPPDLYWSLAISIIEVMNLLFASVDVVWVTWPFIGKEKFPSLRHTNEVIGAYLTVSPRWKLRLLPGLITKKAICCDKDSVLHIQK